MVFEEFSLVCFLWLSPPRYDRLTVIAFCNVNNLGYIEGVGVCVGFGCRCVGCLNVG